MYIQQHEMESMTWDYAVSDFVDMTCDLSSSFLVYNKAKPKNGTAMDDIMRCDYEASPTHLHLFWALLVQNYFLPQSLKITATLVKK